MAVIERQGNEGEQAAAGAEDVSAQQTALAHEVLQNFRIVFSAVKRHAEWVEKQSDLSAAQLWALWEVAEKPGLHVGDLAYALSIHRSTASNLIDKMEKKQLVRKERSSTDQRVVSLYLTSAGSQIVREAPRPARGVLQETLRQLPQGLLNRLNEDLSALIEHLKEVDEHAAFTPLAHILGQDEPTRKRK
jgi:MarR family transcriptional regulator, organic hydroperoxide resistance regulator